jgi:hypothetical protein
MSSSSPSPAVNLEQDAGRKRGLRLTLPTALALAVVFVAAGFWGGAVLEKSGGPSSAGTASAVARFRAGQARAGAASPGAGASVATTGTLSVVDGKSLYLLTSAGTLLKVSVGSSATVTRNGKTGAAALRPGDTVIIQGSTEKNGDLDASSVAATGEGVGSGVGGAGFGGGPAAAAASPTTG